MTKKKQSPRRRAAREAAPQSAAGAREMMAALIRKKEAQVTDGAIQIVMAIASVTTLVTVDLTQDPPVFDPEDLGSLTFNDPRVGMSDEQMAMFKANLKFLLPQIVDEIDQIPDNANLTIADVARFVQLSLQTAA
jgi:hypothetical protein